MLFLELELEVPLSSGDATYQKFLAQENAKSNVEKISEVDDYLRAELVGYCDLKFDLLTWWKDNAVWHLCNLVYNIDDEFTVDSLSPNI